MAKPRGNGHVEATEADTSTVFGWQTLDRPEPVVDTHFDSSGKYTSVIEDALREAGFDNRVEVTIHDRQVYYLIDNLTGSDKTHFLRVLTDYAIYQLADYELCKNDTRLGDAGVAIPESRMTLKKRTIR